MSAATVQELVDALRGFAPEIEPYDNEFHVLLDRLQTELKLRMWPGEVFDVAVEVFGPSINNVAGKTRRGLDRRIGHAQHVWAEKYGPLNPRQERYSSSCLCAAIRAGAKDAQIARGPKQPFVYARLDRVVNHEVVHAGFKNRRVVIDHSAELSEMLR